MLESEA
jgi:hypothetical protein